MLCDMRLHYIMVICLLDGRVLEWSWSKRDNRLSDFIKKKLKKLFFFCPILPSETVISLSPASIQNLKHASTYSFTNQWADTILTAEPFCCHTYILSLLCKICRGSAFRLYTSAKFSCCRNCILSLSQERELISKKVFIYSISSKLRAQ